MDRNSNIGEQPIFNRGRSLRGNVDRNIFLFDIITSKGCVVPYVGTWIEMTLRQKHWSILNSRSLRGNVDRNTYKSNVATTLIRRSLRGNVDRNLILTPFNTNLGCRSLRGNVDRNASMTDDMRGRIQSFPTWERG